MFEEWRTKILADRIQQIRKNKKLTKSKLAEMSELSLEEIYLIEASKRRPRIKTLSAIASALGVSLGELLGEPGPPEDLAFLPVLGEVPGAVSAIDKPTPAGKLPLPLAGLPGGKAEGLWAVRVTGNELAGKGIESGDYLICGPVGDFEGGRVYLARQGDRVIAREIGRLGEGGMELKARVFKVYRVRDV